jgi:hypothetical protein
LGPSGQRVAPPSARGKLHSHLLDKDFVLDHRTVFCAFRAKKTLLLQIAQDSSFLCKAGFSDFVLQVSVATFDDTSLPAVKSWIATNQAYHGEKNKTDSKIVFFFKHVLRNVVVASER